MIAAFFTGAAFMLGILLAFLAVQVVVSLFRAPALREELDEPTHVRLMSRKVE